MTMIIWSFGFLRMGTVGLVAQSFGRGEFREIVRTVLRNLLLAIFFSLIIIILKPLIVSLISKFFPTSAETQNLINAYISIRVFSVPAEKVKLAL